MGSAATLAAAGVDMRILYLDGHFCHFRPAGNAALLRFEWTNGFVYPTSLPPGGSLFNETKIKPSVGP
jgi:hypothetical protein